MRFEALLRLGYEEVPDNWVRMLRGLTDEQKAEFVIKDNANFGEWDYDVLANEWDSFPLSDWTVEIPDFDSERSYTEPPADGDGADVGGGTDAAGAIVVCPSCGHCFARGEEGGKD